MLGSGVSHFFGLLEQFRHRSKGQTLKGKLTGATKFDDFVEAGGSWWARLIETTNAEGKRVTLVTQ